MSKNAKKGYQQIMHLHQETQEEWEERVKVYNEKLEEHKEEISKINKQMETGSREITSIRRTVKKLKDYVKDVVKQSETNEQSCKVLNERYDGTTEKVAEILENQREILVRLEDKKEKDKTRNGKVDKLGEKEDALKVDVEVLKTKYDNVEKLLGTVISLLRALGVGFILFFITFLIKTFFWGI